MPSGTLGDSDDMKRGGVLLVCRMKFTHDLTRVLERNAIPSWRDSEEVKLLPIPAHLFVSDAHICNQIESIATEFGDVHFHVYVHDVESAPSRFADPSGQDRWEIRFSGKASLPVMEQKLHVSLQDLKLDWLSDVENRLRVYVRREVNRERIANWLGQFNQLKHRWVGERLLQALDMWPGHRLKDALRITRDGLLGFHHICGNPELGKNYDFLRPLVKNELDALRNDNPQSSLPEIAEIHEAIAVGTDNNILYVEDGLLTGTEMESVLRALLGKCKPGRKPKTEPLSDPTLLSRKRIQFRFAVTSNFGCFMLNRFLDAVGLTNCEVSFEYDNQIHVLTDTGMEALENGTFWVGTDPVDGSSSPTRHISRPDLYISTPAFQNMTIWRDHAQQRAAIDFCRSIGGQLFKHYHDRKVEMKEWAPWDQRRISECSLGMRGFGLALAYAHSVPKSSIPLFWQSGSVTYRNKNVKRKIEWQPLFPNVT